MNDDTRLRLINAAGAVFAEKGYEAASVREICQLASANIAAINYYFGDKQSLYMTALRYAQTCADAAQPEPIWPPDMPSTVRLREFIRGMLRRKLDSGRPAWHLGIMLREMAHPTEACVSIVEDYVRPMANGLRAILQNLLGDSYSDEKGNLISFSIAGQVTFYYVNQPIVRLLVGDENYRLLNIDKLVDHITEFSLAAMGIKEVPQLPADSSLDETKT